MSRWGFDGNGADLQANNPARILGPTFVPGKFALGLNYAAVGDRVRMTNSSSLDVGLRDGFTVDAWVNPADLTTNRVLAAWGDGTNRFGVEFGFRPGTSTNVPAGLLYANLRDRAGSNHVVEAVQQGLIRTNGFLTNVVYVALTDNTNEALIPIKFAEPDTAPTGRSTNQLLSGFEGPVPNRVARLTAGDRFEGWTVTAGRPAVLNAPLAHTGTNLLVLRDGALFTNVATLPGRMYRLQFAHRREPLPDSAVSWWKGESTPEDVLGTNHGMAQAGLAYLPGKVDQAFGAHERRLCSACPTARRSASPTNSASSSGTGRTTMPRWAAACSTSATSPIRCGSTTSSPSPRPAWTPASTTRPWTGRAPIFRMAWKASGCRPRRPWAMFHHLVATYRQANDTQVELNLFLNGQLQRAKVVGGVLSNAANLGTRSGSAARRSPG